jgi:hypothetical protein
LIRTKKSEKKEFPDQEAFEEEEKQLLEQGKFIEDVKEETYLTYPDSRV